MRTICAHLTALWRRLRDTEPATAVQFAGTVLAALGVFGVAVPLGLDAKIGGGIALAAFVRDVIVGRVTRDKVWSPDSVARLQVAAKALGAPPDKVDAIARLIAAGKVDAVDEMLRAFDPPGQHAAPAT